MLLVRRRQGTTYICATLEEDRLMAGAFGIGKSGYGLSRFVFEPGQHLMHAVGAKRLEKPLATHPSVDIDRPKVESKRNYEYLHVWTW